MLNCKIIINCINKSKENVILINQKDVKLHYQPQCILSISFI